MASVTANGIRIEYEMHGSVDDPAVLMIMGLSGQLTFWPPDMIKAITEAGYRVITFDNRDIGLSQKMHGKRPPNVLAQIALARVGIKMRAPYTLLDMADDAEGLLDALDIARAHVVGVSMGGMIGQVFASTKPKRTASFTSIMSSTNNPALPRADKKVAGPIIFNRARPVTRDDAIAHSLKVWSLIGTPNSGADPSYLRERIEKGVDRCYYPAGVRKQIAAIVATGDLRPYSRLITAPALVIHGSLDPLAPVEGALDQARTIPGARLEIIDGMAHDLPPKFLPKLNGLILEHISGQHTTKSKAA